MVDRVVARGVQKHFPNDTPKTLRGVMPVQLLLLECTDETRKRLTLFAVEVEPTEGAESDGSRFFIFPEGTYAGLGVASDWLQKQLNSALRGRAQSFQFPVVQQSSTPTKEDLLVNEVSVDVTVASPS